MRLPQQQPRRTSRRGAYLVVLLGLLLLAATVIVARQAQQQAVELEGRVVATEDLVDANVRTLSQAQRELLRLEVDLVEGAPVAQVRRQNAFVTQRTHESALDYQAKTLGDRGLLELAGQNESTWRNEVRPAVVAAARSGDAEDLDRARRLIGELEASYNYLVSEGEIARRDQAAIANDESQRLLQRTQHLLAWLGVLFLVSAGGLVLGGVLLGALNRQRTRAQERLQALNDELVWYAKIVEATDSMLVATDVEGRITWVNEAFERFTGWDLAAAEGRTPGELLQGEETDAAVVRAMGEQLRAGAPFQVEVANYTRDGRPFWASVAVSPVHDERGVTSGFISVQTDVTEQHQAGVLLEQARHDALATADAKAAFLATMSHEIRTPLNAVLGLTDLLMQTPLDDVQRDYVGTAHQSGQHLLALVNDVLDFSAIEAGKLEYHSEALDLAGLVDEVTTMFATQADAKDLVLSATCSPTLPAQLSGDPVRLRQLLVNLVGNAVKFTDRGAVGISVRPLTRRADECEVEITVSDTGIGIPSWRIPQLFHSFVRGDASSTRRYGGTGLGLAICKGLVDALGGSIDLSSELDEGTTVVVRLTMPVLETPRSRPTEPGEGLPRLGPMRLLVAEDDPVNQKVVVRMLERLGITPTVVGDGQQAVEAVLGGEYDVVLMDVQMPVVDGVRAVRQIRTSDARQPWVVALTANALSGDRERFLAAGMDDYLSKPMTLESLAAVLDRVGVTARADS